MMEVAIFIVIGLLGGALSGLFGIGGGILIVPALVIAGHLTQTRAQGTSLAVLLLPVGFLGVYEYWKSEAIDFRVAALVAAGFIVGIYGGAKVAVGLDPVIMRKIFAIFLAAVATHLFFTR